MILFIFEGASYEPALYRGIKALFFPRSNDQVLCSFCSSIYTFYKRLKDDFDGFGDVVDILKEEKEKTDPTNEIFKYKSSDFESIYLFFDYDFYWGDIATKNAQVLELPRSSPRRLSTPCGSKIAHLPFSSFIDAKICCINA